MLIQVSLCHRNLASVFYGPTLNGRRGNSDFPLFVRPKIFNFVTKFEKWVSLFLLYIFNKGVSEAEWLESHLPDTYLDLNYDRDFVLRCLLMPEIMHRVAL